MSSKTPFQLSPQKIADMFRMNISSRFTLQQIKVGIKQTMGLTEQQFRDKLLLAFYPDSDNPQLLDDLATVIESSEDQ